MNNFLQCLLQLCLCRIPCHKAFSQVPYLVLQWLASYPFHTVQIRLGPASPVPVKFHKKCYVVLWLFLTIHFRFLVTQIHVDFSWLITEWKSSHVLLSCTRFPQSNKPRIRDSGIQGTQVINIFRYACNSKYMHMNKLSLLRNPQCGCFKCLLLINL